MKAEIAVRLVEALRSGDYEQCEKTLHDGKDFCCLGVLCDLKEDTEWIATSFPKRFAVNHKSGNTAFLPSHIIQWAGTSDHVNSTLSVLNDIKGKSFNEIADYVEANWETL